MNNLYAEKSRTMVKTKALKPEKVLSHQSKTEKERTKLELSHCLNWIEFPQDTIIAKVWYWERDKHKGQKHRIESSDRNPWNMVKIEQVR